MKRYWLFIVEHKYAKGGMDDLAGDYAELEEVMNVAIDLSDQRSWLCGWHIWDSFTLKVIKRDTD